MRKELEKIRDEIESLERERLPDAPPLLTPAELCKWLKVKKSWVKEQLRQRTRTRNPKRRPLPCVRLSKNVIRFDWRDVVEWIQEQKKAQ